jgi:hypothetical protein
VHGAADDELLHGLREQRCLHRVEPEPVIEPAKRLGATDRLAQFGPRSVGPAHPAFDLPSFGLGKGHPDQPHALDILGVQIFAATCVGVHTALLMSQRIHKPFIVTRAPSQTIIGDHDHTTCGPPIREVARPQDPQELLKSFADDTELAR